MRSDILKEMSTCKRKDCEFYCTSKHNKCEILSTVYENDFKCKFYKEKEKEERLQTNVN